MVQNVTIQGEIRNETGKGAARKLRAAGRLPAIAYGKEVETVPLTFDLKAFVDSLKTGQGLNALMTLHVPGNTTLDGKTFMVKELQRDPLSGRPIHADLIEVILGQKIKVEVRLRFVGKARGVEEGGILQELHRRLEIECLPRQIPDFLEIDISALGIGEILHLGDVKLPESVVPLAEDDYPLATVVAPRLDKEPGAGEGAEGEEGGPAGEAQEAGSGEGEKKEGKEE